MFNRETGICLMLLFAAGCSVGPDYHAPKLALAKAYSEKPPTTQSAADQLSVDWWKSFNDPLLDTLIDRTVKSNLTLLQAEARVRAARAQRGVSESQFWPDVNATGGYTRSRSPAVFSGRSAETGAYRAGFDASWELDVFGGTRRSVEAADAQIVAAVEDRRDIMVSLLGEVASTYCDLRAQQERIAIARRNLQSQEKTADVIRRQVAGGFGTALDLANAELQTATTRSQIPVLETNVHQDIHALSVLLALEPAALSDELAKVGTQPGASLDVPIGLPSDLLRRRPDIRRAEAQLHTATAQIGVAVSDLFPRFSLTGEIGFTSNRIKGLGNYSNRDWSVGPGITWNIFSAGRVRNNIKVQEALRDESTLVYRQTVLNALRDVEDALVALDREREHLQSLEQAVSAGRRAVVVAEKLYANGQVDFLNVTTAQRALLQAEDAYAQSRRALAVNMISLYKSLGGGWEESNLTSTEKSTPPLR